MARPSNATVISYTPKLGIPFQWLLDGYASTWQRDGSAEVVQALVSWQDAEDFLQEAVGYTTWDGTSPTLQRVRPLECPVRADMFCDKCELDDFGAYESRSDFFNVGGFPEQDWCIYRLTFTKRLFPVRSDFALAAFLNNQEWRRFCKFSLLPRPRERVVSGYGYAYLPLGADRTKIKNWKTIAEERTFIPDWEIDIQVTWLDVPVGAIPLKTILTTATTVNDKPFQLIPNGPVWSPGELLFKGTAQPIQMYADAANEEVFDLAMLWSARDGGWNNYLNRDPATGKKLYLPMRVRLPMGPMDTEPPEIPPYASADHTRLFVPGAG